MSTKVYIINRSSENIKNKLIFSQSGKKHMDIFSSNDIKLSIGKELLLYALQKDYGIVIDDIYFEYNKYNKPYIKSLELLYFNISYSDNLVACAISKSPVGLDIESFILRRSSLGRRFFSSEEVKYLHSDDEESSRNRFYEIWCCKEAYLKMLGIGFNRPLNSFTIRRLSEGYSVIDSYMDIDCNLVTTKYDKIIIAVCHMDEEIEIHDLRVSM